MGGVIVLGVFGALLVGSLTSPPPVADAPSTTASTVPTPEEPTTTEPWSVSRIETGPRISWRKAFELESKAPIATAVTDEGLYVFVGDEFTPDHYGRLGLSGWFSPDGAFWSPLQPGITAQFEIYEVKTTRHGLAAYGRETSTGAPMLWESVDGATWEPIPLDSDPAWPAGSNVYVGPLVSNDDVTILFGSASISGYEAIGDRIVEHFGDVARDLPWNHDQVSGEIVVYGPMGIPILTASPEELGVSETELNAVANGEGTTFPAAWIRGDDGGWERIDAEVDQVGYGFPGPDGRIWVVSYQQNGGVYATADGVEWERLGGTEMVGGAELAGRFGDFYVGTQWGAFGSHLAMSSDLRRWEPLGPVDLFPSDYAWNTYPVAVAPGGVAGIVNGYSTDQSSTYPPIELTRDGYTLRTDPSRSSEITISRDEEVILRVGLWGSRLPEYVTIDLEAETFTFLDPLSDEPLTTFTFDELTEAETSNGNFYVQSSSVSAIVYSPDGVDWTLQDFSNILRGDGYVADLDINGEDILVLDLAPPAYPLADAGHRLELWIGSR
jgi:hypothetical protein